MSRKRRILRHYEPRIRPGRENFDILDWASADSQRLRFSVLLRNVDLRARTLLDVGCGLGDLWAYLKSQSIDTHYTGVDISQKMLQAARARHPDGRFLHGDPFAQENGLFAPKAFDVVFASGVFNLNLGNNDLFLPEAIARMMDLAKTCVVLNLLHNRTRYKDHHYAYYGPADVQEKIRPIGWQIRLVDDYLANDFTLICRS